jgi:hypothetical protein
MERTNVSRDGRVMSAVQLVLSGQEHFTIDRKKAVLGPGDAFIAAKKLAAKLVALD